MTERPASSGFSASPRRPRSVKRWLCALAVVILLTTAALAGIHMLQSDTGNAMHIKPALPSESRLPSTLTNDAPPAVGRQPIATSIQTPSVDRTDTPTSEGPIEKNHPAPAAMKSASLSSVHEAILSDTRSDQMANQIAAKVTKLPDMAVAKTSPSLETPADPASRNAYTRPRTVENDPGQAVRRKSSLAAEPHSTRSHRRSPPSPTKNETTGTIAEQNAGGAVRKTVASGENGELFYKKALAYHRRGRLPEAIRLYRQVLDTQSNHPGAMQNLAAAAMQQGDYHQAQTLLKQLEHATPRPKGVLLNLAIAAIGTGATEEALGYLDSALAESDASPWEVRFHRAVAYAQMNRLQEALALYKEAQIERPDDPRLQFNLAVTCDTLGLYSEALPHYEAVLQTASQPFEIDRQTITRRIREIGRYLVNAQASAKRQ
jgi:tetratricopeptide (TPR) repeat protein